MERFVLVLALVVFFFVCVGLMALGYRNRRRRHAALPAFPAVPEQLDRTDRLTPLAGVYVSTTTTESWQDRVGRGDYGLRSRVVVHRYPGGVLFDRVGAAPLWVPEENVVHARLAAGLAGKVMGTDSLLVLRWRVGETEFDTGVLADDVAGYAEWLGTFETVTGEMR